MKTGWKGIPSNWCIEKMGSISQNFDKQRIPLSKNIRKERHGNIRYYGASGIIDYVDKPIFDGKYMLIGEDGANLLSRSTPIAFIVQGKFWVNNHAHVLKSFGNIPLKFLSYYIDSIDLSPWITGTAQPKLNQRNLNEIPIPIPPLNEQKRIVSKIEYIFACIDVLEKSLKSVKPQIEQCRQSVLKLAFEGRLVPQDPNDEPAEILLKKLCLDIETKIDAAQYELPKGWVVTTIGKICQKPQYGWTTKASNIGTIKLLRTTDITSGVVNWSTVPFCEKAPKDLEKYLLYKNDIVISRAGSIGFSYLLNDVKDAVFASYLIRFKTHINTKFFYYFLQSPFYWNAIVKKKAGIALANVNATKLKSIQILVPPLNEQKRIVSKIESVFAHANMADVHISKLLETLATLRQSVLKHAFEGKLITQDPHDEPADKLLEKIRGANNG